MFFVFYIGAVGLSQIARLNLLAHPIAQDHHFALITDSLEMDESWTNGNYGLNWHRERCFPYFSVFKYISTQDQFGEMNFGQNFEVKDCLSERNIVSYFQTVWYY